MYTDDKVSHFRYKNQNLFQNDSTLEFGLLLHH